MALRPLERKLLVGVEHTVGEQAKVFDLLRGYSFPSIGLEITPSEFANAKFSQVRHKRYWSILKSHFRNRGVEVVALDHPVVDLPEVMALCDAWGLMKGYLGDFDEVRNEFLKNEAVFKVADSLLQSGVPLSPETARLLSLPADSAETRRILRRAIAVIDEKGKEKVDMEFMALTLFRDAHMLRLIRDRQIPVAVIGEIHAAELSKSLENYEHVNLFKRRES